MAEQLGLGHCIVHTMQSIGPLWGATTPRLACWIELREARSYFMACALKVQLFTLHMRQTLDEQAESLHLCQKLSLRLSQCLGLCTAKLQHPVTIACHMLVPTSYRHFQNG